MAKRALHIAVFCRPLLTGAVKTRLIPAYGAEGAASVYEQLVERTLQTVQSACTALDATASLWAADDCSHPSVQHWATRFSFPVFLQCQGDLGERMFDCLTVSAVVHERTLLVGTDCPALDVGHLRGAANSLTPDCPWVFTPAEDGGYVLVGSDRPSPEPFVGIAWGTGEVMTQTRLALTRDALGWAEMDQLWDVDEPADVERARTAGFINTP